MRPVSCTSLAPPSEPPGKNPHPSHLTCASSLIDVVLRRAIVWLQNKRDANLERHRGPSPRREDTHEYRVGRLKHERVTVPRDEALLDWAMQVMSYHASRKSILEIEFRGEEGTGLGPTLEFYALVAAELQTKVLGLWLCEDDHPDDQQREVDIGRGVKPVGYYVQRSCGLFPAPLPQESAEQAEKLFQFMGTFFAKCIQDGRLVDMPLSLPFLKLICMGDVVDNVSQGYREVLYQQLDDSFRSVPDEDVTPTEEPGHRRSTSCSSMASSGPAWYAGLLNEDDFELVDPHRARFLKQLRTLANQKQSILANAELSEAERQSRLSALTLENPPVPLEDLRYAPSFLLPTSRFPISRSSLFSLTFVFNPSSSVYKYSSYDLKPNGENEVRSQILIFAYPRHTKLLSHLRRT